MAEFLAEVVDWRWDDFCYAEQSSEYTGYQAAVLSLVRAAAGGKLGAIKLAIDRVDGKVETPVKVEYPRVFFLYPNATSVDGGEEDPDLIEGETSEEEPDEEVDEEENVTLGLRKTLEKMSGESRVLVELILQRKREVEKQIKDGETVVDEQDGKGQAVPLVRSVISANLLRLAEKSNFEAIMEVFDQLDGKLVETIRVLGDDIHISSYVLTAPKGAKKNKEGVYMLEAPQLADTWKEKFSND